MGKILDKLLLLLYSLLIALVSIIVVLVSLQVIGKDFVTDFLQMNEDLLWVKSTVIAIAVIVFLISIRFIYISVGRSQSNQPSIDQRTEVGDIRISLETVENLTLKSAARIRGVNDLKARIRLNDAGLHISIRTIVDGESSIPELTEEVQQSVKEYVEQISGVPVAYVSVYVANIVQAQTFRSRVE